MACERKLPAVQLLKGRDGNFWCKSAASCLVAMLKPKRGKR